MNRLEENKNESQEKSQEHRLVYSDIHHLNEVIKEILAYHKHDGLDKFEEISMFIKKKMTKLSFQYMIPKYEPKKCIELTEYEEKIFKNLNKKKPKQVETIANYMEDILSLSRVLEWGGISFSKNEWFKIRLAMKKLLEDNNAVNLRFWGKIFGIESDYYIIQGSLKNYPMKNPKPYVESRGNEGINCYTFWVTNSILEGWYELPDVYQEQLIASRSFKYHFTGDLNAKVSGFNNFPGREAHLLKCQILRIMHSSWIVPDGYLKIDTRFEEPLDSKVTEYNEEFQMPTYDDLKSEDRWVHEFSYIFPNGKVVDPSQETQMGRIESISKDEGYQRQLAEDQTEEVKYWKFRFIGDQMVYNTPNGTTTYASIAIKNSRWPGHNCVWKNSEFANIYIGFGIKATGSSFIPTQPGEVEKDPEGADEYPEPNPEKEEEKIEDDTLNHIDVDADMDNAGMDD